MNPTDTVCSIKERAALRKQPTLVAINSSGSDSEMTLPRLPDSDECPACGAPSWPSTTRGMFAMCGTRYDANGVEYQSPICKHTQRLRMRGAA